MNNNRRLLIYQEALQLATDDYERCDYIESQDRRKREQSAIQPRIDALKRMIASFEPSDLFAPIKDEE